MSDGAEHRAGRWDWAVAKRALVGEDEPGDLALITPLAERTLVGVVDGLGHGQEAAAAARRAIDTLKEQACDDLPELVRRCHLALQETRGAVLTVALAGDDGTVTWTGVGNVEGVVVRGDAVGPGGREHALLLAGVLGMHLPRLRATETTVAPGDRVLFATDGISRSFADDVVPGPPQRTADDILQRFATGRDDALVVVGEYREAAR